MSSSSRVQPNWGRGRWAGKVVALIIGIAILVYSLLPFYLMVVVSLTRDSDVLGIASSWFPAHPIVANYPGIFQATQFGSYLRNSAIISVGTTILGLVVSVPAAYAFSRLRFRGRRTLLFSTLLIYMLPPVLLIVPLLIMFRQFQLYDTYQGIIIADATLIVPFGVWLLVGFFATIPKELEEAAAIDGASPFTAMIRIILPLSWPGVITASVLFFVIVWNEFLYGYTFSSSDDIKPVPAAMRAFVFGEAGVYWGKIMAAAVITSLPVIIVFLIFQRWIIPGLKGGVKG